MPNLEQNPEVFVDPSLSEPNFVPEFFEIALVERDFIPLFFNFAQKVRGFSSEQLHDERLLIIMQEFSEAVSDMDPHVEYVSTVGLIEPPGPEADEKKFSPRTNLSSSGKVVGFMAYCEKFLKNDQMENGRMMDLYVAVRGFDEEGVEVDSWLPSAHISKLDTRSYSDEQLS